MNFLIIYDPINSALLAEGCDRDKSTYLDTPFGPSGPVVTTSIHSTPIGYMARAFDPRATIYAAKELGAERIIALEAVTGLNRLLRPGDWLIPDDWIDQTRGGPTTFFTEHGLGYIPGRPAFCSQTRSWLVQAADGAARRVFDTGVYVGMGGTRRETPAEGRMWAGWGADVAGQALLPEATLARELGLCYASLLWVGRTISSERTGTALEPEVPVILWDQILSEVAVRFTPNYTCSCREYARRAQDLLGEDWRKWLAPKS